MAKENKPQDNVSKTWIMTVGVVFEGEETKELAMREFQESIDNYLSDYKMVEVINAKQGSLSFKIVENEL